MSDPVLQFFAYAHLPPRLRSVSELFSMVARTIVNTLPDNPERSVALRKLLEAKDAAVRAALYQEPGEPTQTTTKQEPNHNAD